MTDRHRATIAVSSNCDNACVFCARSGLEAAGAVDIARVREALRRARSESEEVTFVGGEPTLHPELPELVAEARELGFRAIGLQTNGRRLARSAHIELLRDAGLTDLHLSIHGALAAAHDYHSGVEGSFVAALAALSAGRAAGLDVVVTTVLTRSNARGLSDLPRLLAARGASAWCLSIPRVRGLASEFFDRVVPRLGVAMPFALHAVQTAVGLGLPAVLRGAPECVLGPFARHAVDDEPRAHGSACESCGARARCPGVERRYLERFGGDELVAVTPLARAPIEARFERMFVGVGELSPESEPEQAVHEPPARARVALPMLGRIQPARAEVPRSAEKKTGAALRELFKDLYAKDGTSSE